MGTITVVGLGLTKEHLTLGAIEAVRAASQVLLRTGRSAAAAYFAAEGISYTTLDHLYEQCEDFTQLNDLCVQAVIQAASQGDVVYGVFDLRDASVGILTQVQKDIRLLPGPAQEGPLFALLTEDALCVCASDFDSFVLDAWHGLLLREVDSRTLAGECKIRLSDVYPEEMEVTALVGGALRTLPLCDLDRMEEEAYDHTLSFAIPPVRELTRLSRFGVTQLMQVLARLRAPDGCPWDREQTHVSIRQDLLEESYEVADALDTGDLDALVEELGDVLLQVAFHAQIGDEHSEFTLSDITSGICQKLISRHVHVFGSQHAETAEQVLALWQTVKMEEKGQKTTADSMRSVAKALPALTRARKIAKRAAAVGFCAPDIAGSLAHVRSEIDELQAEAPATDGAEMELGDLLFAITNASVQYKLEPERALEKATDKFLRRFTAMEQKALSAGMSLEQMTLAQMDALWDEVKAAERP